MITYQNASRSPAAFHNLFGCSVAEFDTLYDQFAIAHEQRLAQSALTRKTATPRKRKPGAGRRFKHPLRERLLLALFWLRVYPTFELLGHIFALDRTSAEDNLKDVLATLVALPAFTLELPGPQCQKRHTWEQIVDAFPDLARLEESSRQPLQKQKKRHDQSEAKGVASPDLEVPVPLFQDGSRATT